MLISSIYRFPGQIQNAFRIRAPNLKNRRWTQVNFVLDLMRKHATARVHITRIYLVILTCCFCAVFFLSRGIPSRCFRAWTLRPSGRQTCARHVQAPKILAAKLLRQPRQTPSARRGAARRQRITLFCPPRRSASSCKCNVLTGVGIFLMIIIELLRKNNEIIGSEIQQCEKDCYSFWSSSQTSNMLV